MNVDEAIAVFDKSAERTRPNAQTEAWEVLRAHIAALTARLEAAEGDSRRYKVARRYLSAHMVSHGIAHHDERHRPYLEQVDAAIDAAIGAGVE